MHNKVAVPNFSESGSKLEDFHYNRDVGQLMFDNMAGIEFQGMKGWVKFEEDGSCESTLKLDKWKSKTFSHYWHRILGELVPPPFSLVHSPLSTLSYSHVDI